MMLQLLIISAVSFYQKTLSPDHGFMRVFYPTGYCRYYPSCSEYAKHTYSKHGSITGSIKVLWRVLRCNPWSKGGVDFS